MSVPTRRYGRSKSRRSPAPVQTVKTLAHARIGMMGYADMGLYSTMCDGVSLRAKIGPEVDVFDMLELVQKMDALDAGEVGAAIGDLRNQWVFEQPVTDATLERVAPGLRWPRKS